MHTKVKEKAELLHRLHDPAHPLALANAWDAASARLVEAAGGSAVATTSAGVSWSLGVPDGNLLDRDEALKLIARIVKAVDVPVSADIENGIGDTPDEVAATVTGVIEAGAAGVNIEDSHSAGPGGLRLQSEQSDRLAAARSAAAALGVPLFLNARVDTFLRGVGETPAKRLDETLARAQSYVDAGASGIFVPGVLDPQTITELVKSITVPLNIIAMPGAPSVRELSGLGVARVSLGPRIAMAAYAVAWHAARDLIAGDYPEPLAPYANLNELLSPRG